jgi:hypothetical protein
MTMEHQDIPVLLDDVLFSFRRANTSPTPAAVEAWVALYPRFAWEIQEEAALWAEMELAHHLHRHAAEDERLVKEARSAAVNALFQGRNVHSKPTLDVNTLVDAAELVGITLVDVARQMGLPVSVLYQVNQGIIMGASIPKAFTRMLARLLAQREDWVLGSYPASAIAAHGMARAILAQDQAASKTFQEAVMEATQTDEAKRRFWMEEA